MASLTGAILLLLLVVAIGSVISARRIERARQAEAEQHREAENRLRQGERLINFMLGDLVDRLEPVGRLDVLESTISQVDQFYSSIPPRQLTPESQRHRANALFQFAEIRASQGRLAESVSNYRQAIEAYAQLISAHPTNLQWQFELTRTWNDLGIVFARQDQFTNAAEALENSLHERERLLQLQPTNSYWLGALGATAQNLGQVNRRLGNSDQATAWLRRAESAFRRWIELEPNAPLPKERLATTRGSLGQQLAASGKLEEAAQAYGDKVSILRELLRQDPQHTRRQADLALGLGYVGELEAQQSNWVSAVASLSEGISQFEALVKRDPSNREWLMFLVSQLVDRGGAFRALQRPEEALGDVRQVWQLSEPALDTARQFPEWLNNWRQALLTGEELERELAVQARKAEQPAQAEAHEAAANQLQAKRQTLPK